MRSFSDSELSGVILNGVPGTGMPAFRSLNQSQVRAIVEYVRLLQGKAGERSLPGDPNRGKDVFFGKGGCSECHTISGQGGFLGPDLTEYGGTSSPDGIRNEIVKAPRVPAMGYRAAVLTTDAGERLEGLVRNEDNFSVQLQTRDGAFRFFKKARLRSFDRQQGSWMPADYRDRLNQDDLNNLASYLLTTSDPQKANIPQKKGEEEE